MPIYHTHTHIHTHTHTHTHTNLESNVQLLLDAARSEATHHVLHDKALVGDAGHHARLCRRRLDDAICQRAESQRLRLLHLRDNAAIDVGAEVRGGGHTQRVDRVAVGVPAAPGAGCVDGQPEAGARCVRLGKHAVDLAV